MYYRFAAILFALTFATSVASAKEVAGVQVPETATVENQPLVLNGAGTRTKFFVKVYVGALYLKSREPAAPAVLAGPNPKSIRLHIVYKEISGDQLTEALNDGFNANGTPQELTKIKTRMEQLRGMFTVVRRGDLVRFDLLSNGNTDVWINDNKRGDIAGADFQQALLKIWLGDKPIQSSLKRAMLGSD